MRSAYLAKSVTGATVRALNYSHVVEVLREKSANNSSIVCLGEIARVPTASSYIFRQVDCAPGFGEEILTQADMFAAEPSGRVVRRELMPNPEARRIKRGQILIAGAGQMEETNLFGRSIISDARLVGKVLCGDGIMLDGDEESDRFLYLYAFLCSRYGVQFARSTAYGSSIPRPRLDLLRKLPIPIPDDATLKRVADLIRSTVTNRERYLSEVQAARACLEALPEMQEAIAMCQDRKAYCTLWDGDLLTMNAWNYASAGQALRYLQKKWQTRLGDIVEENGIFRGGRYVRTRCKEPYGVDFLSQRDLFLVRPIPQRIIRPPVSDRLLFPPVGSIIAGGKGTLGEGEIFGRCVFAGDDLSEYALTEDLLRIVPDPEFAEISYAFLSTIVGLRFLRSTAVGTKLLTCREALVRRLPFPEVSKETQAQVKTHVQAGIAARSKAANAEKEAVRIIETEVLPQWLA